MTCAFVVPFRANSGKPGTVVAGASWPNFGVFHMRLFSSLLLFSFLLSGTVQADSKPADKGDGHSHTVKDKLREEMAKEVKKDFEPFGWSVDTALWSFVVFGGLILVLRQFAWQPILKALDDREKSIQKAADDAAKARADAASLRSELDAKLAAAGDQVRQMIDEARRDGQNLREEMLSKAREEISAERERVYRDLETAKNQALQEISLRSIRLASLLTSKVLGKEISDADHSRLLDEAISDLDKTMAGSGAR